MCNRHVLTLFLWTASVGKSEQLNYSREHIEYYNIQPVLKEAKREAIENEVPLICGPFTNWKPKKMTTVFEFLKTQNPLNLLAEKFKKVVSQAKRSTLPSFVKDPKVIMTQIDQN